MTRALHRFVCLALLAAGCEEPPLCTGDRAIQVVHDVAAGTRIESDRAGDHGYYNVGDDRTPTSVYVGPRCSAAVQVARGVAMRPARIHLDPDDDDPTVACDAISNHFFRLDLHGETPPELLYPEYNCESIIPTEYGLIVDRVYGAGPSLWLFPEFPDEPGATLISDWGLFHQRHGDALYYENHANEIARRDLATGDTVILARGAHYRYQATETHLLWRLDEVDTTTPMLLVDANTGAQVETGMYDPAIDEVEVVPSQTPAWQFDPSGKYVVHAPRVADAPIEAFDLAGEIVTLPAPGRLLHLFADGAALSTDAAGQLYHTPIGADDPTTLDHRLEPDVVLELDLDALFRAEPLFPGRIEVLRDDALWAVPLDGAASTALARDVGEAHAWIDEAHLLTVFEDQLVTIDVPDGVRTVHATDVVAFATPGTLSVDGAHYLVQAGADDPASGVWWLPPGLLVAN